MAKPCSKFVEGLLDSFRTEHSLFETFDSAKNPRDIRFTILKRSVRLGSAVFQSDACCGRGRLSVRDSHRRALYRF